MCLMTSRAASKFWADRFSARSPHSSRLSSFFSSRSLRVIALSLSDFFKLIDNGSQDVDRDAGGFRLRFIQPIGDHVCAATRQSTTGRMSQAELGIKLLQQDNLTVTPHEKRAAVFDYI